MRGRYPWVRESGDGERKLSAAVLIAAVKDAQGGDAEAAEWLEDGGGVWAAYLQIPPKVIACWREVERLGRNRNGPKRADMTPEEWRERHLAQMRDWHRQNRGRVKQPGE
jgi:hypothetical protein